MGRARKLYDLYKEGELISTNTIEEIEKITGKPSYTIANAVSKHLRVNEEWIIVATGEEVNLEDYEPRNVSGRKATKAELEIYRIKEYLERYGNTVTFLKEEEILKNIKYFNSKKVKIRKGNYGKYNIVKI